MTWCIKVKMPSSTCETKLKNSGCFKFLICYFFVSVSFLSTINLLVTVYLNMSPTSKIGWHIKFNTETSLIVPLDPIHTSPRYSWIPPQTNPPATFLLWSPIERYCPAIRRLPITFRSPSPILYRAHRVLRPVYLLTLFYLGYLNMSSTRKIGRHTS